MKDRTKIFLMVLFGVALLHLPSLTGGFVWDDHEIIEENPALRDFGNLPGFFRTNYFGDRANVELFRPLVNVTLLLDWHLWGSVEGEDGPEGRPFGFRLTNLLLHLSVGVLLYALVRRLEPRRGIAELSAVLFLVHPASVEPTAWIVGRGDLLAAGLGLAAIHLHLSGRAKPGFQALALLAYFAALFGKLSAAPIPLLVLLVEKRFRGERPATPASLWRYASYAVPIAAYALVRGEAMGGLVPEGIGVTWKGAGDFTSLFVSGAILFRYVQVFLFPVRMCADYSADPVFSDGQRLTEIASLPQVTLLAAGTIVLVTGAILLRRRTPWLSFGILWFFVALLPVSQVVRIGAVMADRYLYLPSAGACIGLGAGLVLLPRFRVPLAAAVLLAFSALTFFVRLPVWQDDLAMNHDVVKESSYPGNADAWNRIGLAWGDRGNAREEEAAYRRGVEAAPGNRFLRKNLGAVLYERRALPEAREHLQIALRLSEKRDLQKAKIAYNLSLVLVLQGEEAGAALVLEEAVLCRPPLALAFERLGRLYRDRLDRPDRAAELLDRARRIRAEERRGP